MRVQFESLATKAWQPRIVLRYNEHMKPKRRTPENNRVARANGQPAHWYRGPDIPMRVIRHFARQVADRFQPEKVILFGSYAYGQPHTDSDVDILVIMPAKNEIAQAVRIDRVVDPLFPLDLIVCTPKNIAWRLKEGDSFL